MTHFHVRLSQRGQQHDEVKTDLNEEELDGQFVTPYRMGESITVNGRTIPIEELERIRISQSEEPSGEIIASLQARDRSSPVVRLGGPGYKYRAAAVAADVTDNYITGPPGMAKREPGGDATPSEGGVRAGLGDARSVFLVSGRDTGATVAVKTLLRSLSVRIVEWEDAVFRVGTPNPYIGDVVMAGMQMAHTVLVLFTPDDVVNLRQDLIGDEDGVHEREPRGQPRPNVLYEAGVADALGRARTVLVEVGPVKSFSDISGRLILRYDGSSITRKALVDRLTSAGLEVDTSGSDWLVDGDAQASIDAAHTALKQVLSLQENAGNRGEVRSFGADEGGPFGVAGQRITATEGAVIAAVEGVKAGGPRPKAHGRVTNNESYRVDNVSVRITYYDGDDNTLGSAWGSVSGIAPGQSKAIECSADSSSVLKYDRHFVQIDHVL